MKRISIIVPVYQAEAYLADCIESILSQTFRDFELILIDDGSKDRGGEICDEYAAKDDRIIVIHQDNKGLPTARNRGLEAATGEYIGFIDSDDWIHEKMYETLYRKTLEYNADIVQCRHYKVSNDSSENICGSVQEDTIFNKEEACKQYVFGSNLDIYVWNKIYKKHLFEKIQFRSIKAHEDLDISYRLLSVVDKIISIPDILYYYRYNPNSITNKKRNGQDTLNYFLELYDVYLYLYRYYLLHVQSIADLSYCNVFSAGHAIYSQLNQLIPKEKDYSKYIYLITYDKQNLIRVLKNADCGLPRKFLIAVYIIHPDLATFAYKVRHTIKTFLSRYVRREI